MGGLPIPYGAASRSYLEVYGRQCHGNPPTLTSTLIQLTALSLLEIPASCHCGSRSSYDLGAMTRTFLPSSLIL